MNIKKSIATICETKNIYQYISYAMISYAIVLRFYYYFYSKFLWQDEAWLFFSLYKSNFLCVFTQSNPYFQTYPSLFALLTWFGIKIFGVSPYLLRFIPFLSSCLYFILIYIVAKKIINIKYAMICIAISIFNVVSLYYCDEFKQYSVESIITIILLIYYLNNKNIATIKFEFVLLSIFAILFSVPSPFIIITIIGCFFTNYLKTRCADRMSFLSIVDFLKQNIYKFVILIFFATIYYYFCLRTGDANNGNAWKNGMIPPYYTEWIEWFKKHFFIILSRLLSNTKNPTTGSIFLFFSFAGCFLIFKQNDAFSKFIKILIPVFIISLCRIYSLGNALWGVQGARLSMYLLPIFILTSGFFVYRFINYLDNTIGKLFNKLFIKFKNKNIKKYICHDESECRNKLFSLTFVVLSIFLSVNTILYMNEWNYNKYNSYDEIIHIFENNKNNIIVAHSYMWYSLQYYNIYKKKNFKIEKLGNQKTPNSEYPPKSADFTLRFVSLLENLHSNQKILVIIPNFFKDRIVPFIDNCGCVIEYFNFGVFSILVCKK